MWSRLSVCNARQWHRKCGTMPSIYVIHKTRALSGSAGATARGSPSTQQQQRPEPTERAPRVCVCCLCDSADTGDLRSYISVHKSGQVLCLTFSLCARFIFDLARVRPQLRVAPPRRVRSALTPRDDRTLGAVRARSFAPPKPGAASAGLGGSSGCRLCRLCLIAHEAS